MSNASKIKITSELLKSWGHLPGREFGNALRDGSAALAEGRSLVEIREMLETYKPAPKLKLARYGEKPFAVNIEAASVDEQDNISSVKKHMSELMRTPTIEAGAIMPDACPAGPLGTIPVGGVVATRNAIHPGMHSSDICCSVMLSNLGKADPEDVLNKAQSVTHFGPGGRHEDSLYSVDQELSEGFCGNRFLAHEKIQRMMHTHMGTQGDGNHFLFVGKSRKTGDTCIVTHHGSRGPGAVLYKLGMEIAERFRRKLSPETLKQNAWIPADTEEGVAYWEALQLIRQWTKSNHAILHQSTVEGIGAELHDCFWNEHNFVFKRDDLYFHGKGATPAWDDYADDATGLTLIPLNMSEPVLVVKGGDAEHGLGFSPHGAGRNFSRSEHKRRNGNLTPEAMLERETDGLDIRFYEGKIDISELPSGYKNADSVVSQIEKFGLAEIDDYIDPYGCIMAGDIEPFWMKEKRKRKQKKARKA